MPKSKSTAKSATAKKKSVTKAAVKVKTAVKATPAVSGKPKKISKIGEWWLKHPHGLEGTYDLRAVMK